MNKKEFKGCMIRGLGRCAVALKTGGDIGKYKDIVLWGCLNNVSYDVQSEGTRSDYIYALTTYFNDESYFLEPCLSAFECVSMRKDDLFAHYCELLRAFAVGGNEMAKNALLAKYDSILNTLLAKKRFRGYDFDRDNFERLCLALSALDFDAYLLKIACDMGRLFRENKRYTGQDFDWFMSALDDNIGKKKLIGILSRESKKSPDVAVFYENYKEATKKLASSERAPLKAPTVEEIIDEVNKGRLSVLSRVRFFRSADDAEKERLADAITKENDLDKKAELLSVFDIRDSGMPLPHKELVGYARSKNEKLRRVALNVLTSCQCTEARVLALELLSKDEYKTEAIEILINNYAPLDKELLLAEIGKIKVDYEGSGDWHNIGSRILNACDLGVKLPREFFLYVYNTTLCSCCREYAVRALAKGRWLTPEIIEECRYDSNCDISAYVNRYYK